MKEKDGEEPKKAKIILNKDKIKEDIDTKKPEDTLKLLTKAQIKQKQYDDFLFNLGKVEELEEEPSEYDDETGERKPKIKKYKNKEGVIYEMEEPVKEKVKPKKSKITTKENLEEEPSEEIEEKDITKKRKVKKHKPKKYINEKGEEIEIEEESSDKTDKPKTEKIKGKDGKVVEIKKVIKEVKDGKTGKKKK